MDENKTETETEIETVKISSNKNLQPSNNRIILLIATIIITASVSIGAVIAVAPDVKKITLQEQRLKDLENEINNLRSEKEKNIPSEFENKLNTLNEQINDIKSISVEQRITKLEGNIKNILQQANSFELRNMLSRIEQMRKDPNGAAKIQHVISSIITSGNEIKNNADELVRVINRLRDFDPQIAETFNGVASDDVDSAVLLMGASQIKQALNEDNKPFDKDLEIVKMTSNQDDKMLQQIITDISPYAISGILTPKTLANELQKIKEDVVKASINDEISLKDKVLTNIAEVIKIEKNGKLINGNATQIILDETQKHLNNGNIDKAINSLTNLKGKSAETIKPFITLATATFLGQQLQQLLEQNILLSLQNGGN